ncbi:MAG: response regulator [bacterium]|nr:response regulator [bacterium]
MKQSILAVDDEPHILMLLERVISGKTNYEITTVPNSMKVPKILKDRQFDLIITDLKLPGLGGMDILKLVKENNREEEVIIITAFGSLETATEALSLGVFDYITKPFWMEQLIFAIDRVMRWQAMKKEFNKLSSIFTTEPYSKARKAFDTEYVQKLSARVNNKTESMIKRSGLSSDSLQEIMSSGQS